MTSFDQPWRPQLDWSAPAGRVLDQLVEALPTNRQWEIIAFGSSPLQLGMNARFLSGDVDVISDEESAGNPAHNTQLLWQELFKKEIDVRSAIITPALTERRRNHGNPDVSWKAALSKTRPSK
jgi:hypothetical protein